MGLIDAEMSRPRGFLRDIEDLGEAKEEELVVDDSDREGIPFEWDVGRGPDRGK